MISNWCKGMVSHLVMISVGITSRSHTSTLEELSLSVFYSLLLLSSLVMILMSLLFLLLKKWWILWGNWLLIPWMLLGKLKKKICVLNKLKRRKGKKKSLNHKYFRIRFSRSVLSLPLGLVRLGHKSSAKCLRTPISSMLWFLGKKSWLSLVFVTSETSLMQLRFWKPTWWSSWIKLLLSATKKSMNILAVLTKILVMLSSLSGNSARKM